MSARDRELAAMLSGESDQAADMGHCIRGAVDQVPFASGFRRRNISSRRSVHLGGEIVQSLRGNGNNP